MRHLPNICLALLALSLSACQLFKPTDTVLSESTRLQGIISLSNQQWVFQPCATTDSYSLEVSANLDDELNSLLPEAANGLFADLTGQLDKQQGHFTPSQRYRLQTEGHGCDDPDFPRLLMRASGNEPFWSLLQTPKGLLLNQIGEETIALPYIEEQLPEGRFIISSQANHQDLQLWLTPSTCRDSMSGTIYHLTARLKLDQQVLHGCASFGAMRK